MEFLLYLAIVPALGFAAQWLAWRTNLPSILVLLLFGMVLGQFVKPDVLLAELLGGDPSSSPALLFPLVSLAVAVIMFEGGLSLDLSELRESGTAAFRLCTVGAAITWAGGALAAYATLGFGWRLSALLGAILVVTGPTVIGPLLRQVRPRRRVATTLKWEGIVIDPIGAILAVLVFEEVMADPQASVGGAIVLLLRTVTVGLATGVLGGAALTAAFRRFLVPDNLQGVCALSLSLLLFAICDHFAGESGLIAVTVLGIWLSNQKHFDVEHIIEFKENLRTLLIACLFIVLGSRVNLSDVLEVGWPGIGLLVLLIVIVRPVSVFVSLLGTPLDLREKTFIAALAPRGIVAAAVGSVFAIKMEPLADDLGIPAASQLDTVTFLVIVGTVTVYGLLASPLAKRLGLAEESTNGVLIAGADAWIREFAIELKKSGILVLLVDTNFNKISNARTSGLDAICGNILNEHLRDELTLTGIGKMLAMTPNDEVNSLALRECRTLFDRANLYQLSFNPDNQHYRRGMTKNLMGRELFDRDLTHTRMRQLHAWGATFKTTPLSEAFDYAAFLARYGSAATLLCVIGPNGNLRINTVASPLAPTPGDKVVTLIRAPEDVTADVRTTTESDPAESEQVG
jgi:CPA1 family monovalent cation:H+ antiporter